MTEAEWLALDEREVRRLVGGLTPRRQRLLAVAACRVLDTWVDYPSALAALETAERFADTGKTKSALRASRQLGLAPKQTIKMILCEASAFVTIGPCMIQP